MKEPIKKANYNRLALQGFDFDDMDFVEEFNLDARLAYTPKINTVMLDLMYQKNLKSAKALGKSNKQALYEANKNKSIARGQIKELYTIQGITADV